MSKYLWMMIGVATPLLSVSPANAQSGNGAVIYTYDALGRVTGASYDNNTTITYSYDAAGNRIQQSVAIGSPPGSPPSPPPTPGLLPGSSLWTTVGSSIYYNGGNVGIGTASPTAPLHVSASFSAVDFDFLGILTNTGGANSALKLQGTTGAAVLGTDSQGDTYAGALTAGKNLRFYSNGAETMRLASNGYLGIGTAAPSRPLEINTPAGTAAYVRIAVDGGNVGHALFGMDNIGEIVIWNESTGAGNHAIIGTQGNGSVLFSPGNGEKMRITPAGAVGIGTSSPNYALEVNGTAYAAGALSDRRHKDKIKPLAIDGLAAVEKLRPVSFVWKAPKETA